VPEEIARIVALRELRRIRKRDLASDMRCVHPAGRRRDLTQNQLGKGVARLLGRAHIQLGKQQAEKPEDGPHGGHDGLLEGGAPAQRGATREARVVRNDGDLPPPYIVRCC